MEDIIDNNKVLEINSDPEEIEFVYNFINTPWDDRSNRSKWGIVSLLVAIFVATMACVINNFVMHYRHYYYYNFTKTTLSSEMSCLRAKMADYNFVARIHLVSTGELLCIGAVLSPNSIIANGICTQSGPVRLQLGSQNNHRCKKGFSVEVIEPINHEGVASKTLVLLTSYENMARCSEVVHIGFRLNLNNSAQIIGRSLHISRSFTRQVVTLANKEYFLDKSTISSNKDSLICVKDLLRCPVRSGDLIIQNGKLFGLAVHSFYKAGTTRLACFADLRIIRKKLKELDSDDDPLDSDNERK